MNAGTVLTISGRRALGGDDLARAHTELVLQFSNNLKIRIVNTSETDKAKKEHILIPISNKNYV